MDVLQVPAIEDMVNNLDFGQQLLHLSVNVNLQFGNVLGEKRVSIITKIVIKVLGSQVMKLLVMNVKEYLMMDTSMKTKA